MSPKIQASYVEVKQSPLHGRGLYAVASVPSGTIIGTYPVLILSEADTAQLKQTRLYHYVFYVKTRLALWLPTFAEGCG